MSKRGRTDAEAELQAKSLRQGGKRLARWWAKHMRKKYWTMLSRMSPLERGLELDRLRKRVENTERFGGLQGAELVKELEKDVAKLQQQCEG